MSRSRPQPASPTTAGSQEPFQEILDEPGDEGALDHATESNDGDTPTQTDSEPPEEQLVPVIVDPLIKTVSEFRALSPADREEFRRNNGTVTNDPA